MKHLEKSTILSGPSPWALEQRFTVVDKPYWLSAFGLGSTDKICVRRVLPGNGGGGFSQTNCGVSGPSLGSIDAREFVNHCGVRLCMCAGQSTLAVVEPGEYELVAEGSNIAAGLVTVIGEYWNLEFEPPEPCKDCDTPPYCASIPLIGGGFGYHENDIRDPAATVMASPCYGAAGVDKVFLYPTAGPGHTARQNDCEGNLIGYGANQSTCAVSPPTGTGCAANPPFATR